VFDTTVAGCVAQGFSALMVQWQIDGYIQNERQRQQLVVDEDTQSMKYKKLAALLAMTIDLSMFAI